MIVADALAGGGGDDILGNLTAPIDFEIGKHSMFHISLWLSSLTLSQSTLSFCTVTQDMHPTNHMMRDSTPQVLPE